MTWVNTKSDLTVLFCPECGSEYPVKDTVKEQDIQTDVPPSNSNTTKIISARKKRKHYDNFGTLIPEDNPIAINESLGAGFKKLIYYKEDKKGEGYHTVKR